MQQLAEAIISLKRFGRLDFPGMMHVVGKLSRNNSSNSALESSLNANVKFMLCNYTRTLKSVPNRDTGAFIVSVHYGKMRQVSNSPNHHHHQTPSHQDCHWQQLNFVLQLTWFLGAFVGQETVPTLPRKSQVTSRLPGRWTSVRAAPNKEKRLCFPVAVVVQA